SGWVSTSTGIAGCTSLDWAWTDLLQTAGNSPASLVMPPFWPPMPSPQALQAFLDVSALAVRTRPALRAVSSAYSTFFAPPPTVRRITTPTVAVPFQLSKSLDGRLMPKTDPGEDWI